MKLLAVGVCLLTAVSSYAAEKYSLYNVEPMTCTGEINEKPRGMAEGYEWVKLELTSFYSVRKDGTKANSLQVDVSYGKTKDTIKGAGSTWYMGPLRRRTGTDEVYRPELSGRDDALELEITDSKIDGNSRRDKLEGTWVLEGTVVGDYAYDLSCRANVVKKPSKTLDFTAEKNS